MEERLEYRFNFRPYEHQLSEFRRTKDLAYWARFWEMGTGKSKTLLDEAGWLYDNGKINALLVLANKGSYATWWEKHVPEHLPSHIERYVTHWDADAGVKLEKTYEEIFRARGLRILVMNVEALSTPSSRAFQLAQRFATFTSCMCVIDESSSIKNPKATRTKQTLRLSRLFKYRRIMTGTPAANGPLNVYSQAEFLSPGLLGHSSWYSYRNEYCVLVDMKVTTPRGAVVEFKKVAGYRNLEKLRQIMSTWSSTILKENCLDLPPKIYETYDVDLTDEQRRVYEDLRTRSVAELSAESIVTAQLALTKILRLQQVLCGYVVDQNEVLVPIPNNRVDSLLELLEETSGKVVIWSRFVKPIEEIKEALLKNYDGECVITYYGETKDRGEAVRTFQDGNARFFVGNPQTGGYGITLTSAPTVVYYANSFDLEQRLQSEDRTHRIGQERSVTYVDMVARGTVDEKILKALREKKRLQDMLLEPGSWRSLI